MTDGELRVVCARIEKEMVALSDILGDVYGAMKFSHVEFPERKYIINSIALDMHGFYNGLERLFEDIAAKIDRTSRPTGDMWHHDLVWHHDLLDQMTMDLKEIRPAVLRSTTAKDLDEYRKFRHVVRHTYTFDFVPEDVLRLASKVEKVFEAVEEDLINFCKFAAQAASEI